jgi:hypothetical protein
MKLDRQPRLKNTKDGSQHLQHDHHAARREILRANSIAIRLRIITATSIAMTTSVRCGFATRRE